MKNLAQVWLYGPFIESHLLRQELANSDDVDGETGVVDELQLDPLLEMLANRVFPYCTVLTRRAKYFFMAPAIAILAVENTLEDSKRGISENEFLKKFQCEVRKIETIMTWNWLKNSNREKPDRIIGISFFKDKEEYGKSNEVYPRNDSLSQRDLERSLKLGIQASFGMHATARFFKYALRLFNAEQELGSVEFAAKFAPNETLEIGARLDPLDFLEDLFGANSKFFDIVEGHIQSLRSMLRSPDKVHRKITYDLTSIEIKEFKGAFNDVRMDKFPKSVVRNSRLLLNFTGNDSISYMNALAMNMTAAGEQEFSKQVALIGRVLSWVRLIRWHYYLFLLEAQDVALAKNIDSSDVSELAVKLSDADWVQIEAWCAESSTESSLRSVDFLHEIYDFWWGSKINQRKNILRERIVDRENIVKAGRARIGWRKYNTKTSKSVLYLTKFSKYKSESWKSILKALFQDNKDVELEGHIRLGAALAILKEVYRGQR